MSADYVLLVLLLGIVGVIICSSLALHARSKERMRILKTGIKPEEKPYRRERLLIGGFSLIGIGLALWIGSRPIEFYLKLVEHNEVITFISVKQLGFISGLFFLLVGIASTIATFFFVKKHTLSPQQITQRRETMRALLKQLDAFERAHDTVVITLITGSDLTGDIKKIIDDELLDFKEQTQTEPTYIPIDRIIWVRKA